MTTRPGPVAVALLCVAPGRVRAAVAPPVPARYVTLAPVQRLLRRRVEARRAFEQRQMLRELGLLDPCGAGGRVRPAERPRVFRTGIAQTPAVVSSERPAGWPVDLYSVEPERVAHA